MSETSSQWIETGAVVLRAAGRGVRFFAGLSIIALGLGLIGVCIYGLALPDAELVKAYVGLIAGAKAGAASAVAASPHLLAPQRLMMADPVPVLAWVVIGVRLVLVAGLLFAVGIVSEGGKFWREV